MPRIAPDSWEALGPYLDEALKMPEEERGSWLASLDVRNPAMAALLRTLLEGHRALVEERFLEANPVSLPVEAPCAGQAIGAYTLVSPIGQGGMGTVWLAERSDGRFERRAAVKFLNFALAGRDGKERFRREGRILGRLAHPHIAQLFDAGVLPKGQPYLVLEYVEGEPIDRYCARRELGVEALIRLFLDVLAAVAHAHANLIVHRDIKPMNVLVHRDGQVKLLDFGIAKLLEEEEGATPATLLTREGIGPLTPEYAAPEQVTGGAITTATDIYGLGVLLYLLLTGQHPAGPGPRSPADLIRAVVETEPARPSEAAATPARRRHRLRGDLDTIAGKALKKNPRERYLTVTALADDLRRYLRHEPIAARPDTLAYRTARFVRRNRLAVSLAALAFAASLGGVVGTQTEARNAHRQRDFALRQLMRAEDINDLNSFLLSDAAPLGKPFTVDELLGQAERILERQQGDGASRADLLISLGRQYWTLDEKGKASRVLDEAYKLSRGLADRSTRARASCALAGNLVRTGEPRRAEALIKEGLGELPDEPQFALDRVFCLLRGAEIARDQGASEEAIARAEAALHLLKQSPFPSELLELRTFMDLAECYRIAGRLREAILAFEKAWSRLAALGRDQTQTAGTLLNNWALVLYLLGRPAEAESLFRRAIAISTTGENQQSVSPMLLINNARALRDLGQLEEAAAQAERGYAKARQEGDQVIITQALLLRSTISRLLGDLARAAELLSEAEILWGRSRAGGDTGLASITSERGLIAQARGDLDKALALTNEAVSMTEASVKAGRQGSDLVPRLLVRRSGIELALQRPADAAADAGRALAILQQVAQPGTFSSYLGSAHLALGRALQAQGKHDEARPAFQSAAEHFQNALGPDHPDTRSTRQFIEPAMKHR